MLLSLLHNMIWYPGIDPWLETFYYTIENWSKYKYISTYAFAGFTCGVTMLLETAGKISLASKQTRSFPSRCQSDPYMKEIFFSIQLGCQSQLI